MKTAMVERLLIWGGLALSIVLLVVTFICQDHYHTEVERYLLSAGTPGSVVTALSRLYILAFANMTIGVLAIAGAAFALRRKTVA